MMIFNFPSKNIDISSTKLFIKTRHDKNFLYTCNFHIYVSHVIFGFNILCTRKSECKISTKWNFHLIGSSNFSLSICSAFRHRDFYFDRLLKKSKSIVIKHNNLDIVNPSNSDTVYYILDWTTRPYICSPCTNNRYSLEVLLKSTSVRKTIIRTPFSGDSAILENV